MRLKYYHILIIVVFTLSNCSIKRKSGNLMVYMDEYVNTTASRYFNLTKELSGEIIDYELSKDGNGKYYSNPTAIAKLSNGDTITVFSVKLLPDIKVRDSVIIKPTSYNIKDIATNPIYKQFPKGNVNYPMYKCVSCKYQNTIAELNYKK
ncbi:hypothetical protein [Pedobacter helvus]|uniref:Lipoprotein n=1 Tax=Pedobacter helvus TaxID=2563444 RepID=A0ABW9JHA7_9SPHI|nr:hypothetical protein [Pedobacter ureilyticus]